MYDVREYSDFSISWQRRRVTRRGVIVGVPAAIVAAAIPMGPADAQYMAAFNAINAAVGVITNIDALTERMWPKIERFFHGSGVSAATVSRVTEAVGNEVTRPSVQAVSIAQNRTPTTQAGHIQHYFNQTFSDEYVAWCTCNAQYHQRTADYWQQFAAQAESEGRYQVANWARTRASRDASDAAMWTRKLQGNVRTAPVPAELPPTKPMLTAVSAPPDVTNVLDQGDYFMTHVTAHQTADAGLSAV